MTCDEAEKWLSAYGLLGTNTILSHALTFAVRGGLIPSNPIAHDRPRFHRAADVQHCREFAPASGDELHLLAAKLFERPQTEALGWQLLFEAFTGCRTSEVLDLRMDAKDNSTPGFIEGDWLRLKRRKNGINHLGKHRDGRPSTLLAGTKSGHKRPCPK